MPTDAPSTWISTDPDPASTAARAVAFVLIMLLSFLLAVAVRGAVRGGSKSIDPATRQLFRRPPVAAPWASGEWACGRCRTVNRAARSVCERCRTSRAEAEMAFDGPAPVPDIIPAEIPAGVGGIVILEHNAAAHADGLNGHWRLRVNSTIVGSAARRDGALALLRAVTGAEAVLFDPEGDGYAPYGLLELIAAFEAPRLPIRTPCPEAAL